MSLIEEYYELNESEEVSVIWKVLQIGFYICAGCLGLWCGYTMAILRLRFDDRCYLFTEVKTSTATEDMVDQSNINWESDMWCDYYQFSMVSSFIVAIIWATFFLMCGKGGKSLTGFVLERNVSHLMGQRYPAIVHDELVFEPRIFLRALLRRLPQPWRVVWSSLLFNFLFFIIVLSTAVKIQQGTDYFCARHDLGKIIRKIPSTEDCEPLKLLLKKNLLLTLLQLEIVVKTSWGCAVSWIILFLLSFFRIIFVVDFRMYKICVFKIDDTVQNKKEEVLRITNYEELKHLQYGKEEEKRFYNSVSEDTLVDVEAGNSKKPKADKKSMRHHFNTVSRSQVQMNAAFYVTADLRMLNRDKKRKKSTRALDEAFGSRTYLGPELRKSIKIHSGLTVSDVSESSKYFYQYPQKISDEEDDENELESTSSYQKLDFIESSDESEDEIYNGGLPANDSLGKKKRI